MPWTIFDQRLLDARNRYAYPLVYIDSLAVDPTGNYIPVPAAQTMQFLDDWEKLHSARLLSRNPMDALLGVVSIAYWGFYGAASAARVPTPERALARARWAANGRTRAKSPHPGPSGARAALQAAAQHLAAGDIASSIRSVTTLPEFGQLSFGSKVLTAMSFEQCGIYDGVVAHALHVGGWEHLAVSANQDGVRLAKADVYARWCRQLAARAAEMNAHGPQHRWDYHGIEKRPWRAVDVERGFFQDPDVRLLGSIVP